MSSAFDPKTAIHETTFLESGELIVTGFDALYRLDRTAKRVVLAKRLRLGSHAVSGDGRLFVAEGNKVFEWGLADFKRGKQVPFPAKRGDGGRFGSLVCSPDGTKLVAVAVSGDLFVRSFADGAIQTFPAPSGCRRDHVRFMRSDALGTSVQSTYTQIVTLDGRSGNLINGAYADYRDQRIAISDLRGPVRLITENEKTIAKLEVDGEVRSIRFIPEQPWIAITTTKALYLADAAKLMLLKKVALPEDADSMYVTSTQIMVVAYEKAIHFFALPALTTGSRLASAIAKDKLADKKATPTGTRTKTAARALPSEYRARIQAVIDRLRLTPGITVTATLGGNATAAGLETAEAKLGALPAAMKSLWTDVDGFSIDWREDAGTAGGLLGVHSLAQLATTSSEDELWNSEFADQHESTSLPLATLKRARVLYSLPGRQESLGIVVGKKPVLCFGAPNTVYKLSLGLEAYVKTALATAGILSFHDALLGSTTAQAKAKKRIAAEVQRALPGWPRIAWP